MTLCLEPLNVKQDHVTNEFLNVSQKQPRTMFFYELGLKQDHLFHVSSAVEDVIGYSPTEVARNGIKWFVEQIHPDDLKRLNHAANPHSHLALMPCVYYRLRTQNGNFRRVCEHRHLLRDSNRVPSFLVGRVEII